VRDATEAGLVVQCCRLHPGVVLSAAAADDDDDDDDASGGCCGLVDVVLVLLRANSSRNVSGESRSN